MTDKTFENCKNLQDIILPSSITSIDDWAFSHCEKLMRVMLPTLVKRVGKQAFDCEIIFAEG